MRFSRNGEDMGVAFAKFDTELEWFPAISLAVDQECELVFGPGLQKLSYVSLCCILYLTLMKYDRYVPEGYSPVFGNYHSSPGAHPERVPRHGSTSSDLLTEPSSISECLFSVRFVLPTEKSYFQIPVVGIEDIFSGALLLIGLFVSAQEDGTNDLKLRLFAVDVADDIDEALLQMDQKPTLSDDASSFVTPPSPSSSEEFFESVGEQSLSPESESSRFLCTTVPVVDIILPSQGIDNEQSDSATQPVRDLAENSSLAWVSRGTIECRYLEIEGRVYFTFNGSVIGMVPSDTFYNIGHTYLIICTL